ncbi:DUF1707 SHOCT-like domain-containing protein [Nocardia bovistercoris]|uniref:DUF1707 domain-containing protein n=1 Tax=Nocardia bovistercoris TaxID=2785916 RepID=A0A931N4G5_9NOCA|nr:DUF1707 domain-containing protein [Nocardia bovistercoris]MBH0778687.1 DUF1707 domain-containing protein [Nocardia bovistercoris]
MGGPESESMVNGGAVGDRDLRVSDVEREHVGELLQRAVGLGMLSLGEFTERMDTALAAKTRGELNSVLVDLPGMRLIGGPAAPRPHFVNTAPPPYRARPMPPRPRPTNPGNVIRSRMSGVNRRGPWQVPPSLLLNNWFSGVTLDFTEAVMSTQVVEMHVDDYCSSLNLIVPAEATVDLDNVDLIGSSVNNKVRSGPPLGKLHLVVHGSIRFGSVTAKHPFAVHWRKILGH